VTISQRSRRQIQLNNLRTAYLDEGQGETIVALHGIPTSSLLFAPLLPHLSNYRLIAPDLLGQGQTETPAIGPLDHSAYAEHLRAFMEAVPPPRFHLLIHDLGGVLGLDWTTEHVERLESLIILSTTITESFRVGKALYAANLVFGRSVLRWAMQFTLKRPQKLDATLIDEWVKPWSRRRILRGTDHFAGHHLQRIRAKLNRIPVPVLIIWGEQDDIFPLRRASSIVRALPQARMFTIKQCGHWSVLDAPDEIAQLVKFFTANGQA
jgi:pimeloyl-ACP methyl ester carboxylesterase